MVVIDDQEINCSKSIIASEMTVLTQITQTREADGSCCQSCYGNFVI